MSYTAVPTTPTSPDLLGKSTHQSQKKVSSWGRDKDISGFTVLLSVLLLLTVPFLVIYFWSACTHYKCSLVDPLVEFSKVSPANRLTFLYYLLPKPTLEGFQLFFGWLLFQAALYHFVPGPIAYGQETPAGHTLPYVVNGFRVWVITHVLFLALSTPGLGLFRTSIIANNWGGILVAANVYGYFLTFFSFLKAHTFPSHPEDCKFSGSFVYDLFMGIEMNPRLGKWFDFKLFHNGRPGIVAWTLINLSFAAAEWESQSYISKEMIALNFWHAVYVVDFFWNEDWYLKTIDIAHEHFGFYLCWGDSVWLPFMYTLQSHYLLRNYVNLSLPIYALIWASGAVGYYIFRKVNNQKTLVRMTDGKCNIWGKPATFIRAKYTTNDGKEHNSILLTSGYWGWSRHFNYVGDLLMCFAFCACCGFTHLLPYFYLIYMTILLVHRIWRDDHRLQAKYGKYWHEYKRQVPWKLLPFIY